MSTGTASTTWPWARSASTTDRSVPGAVWIFFLNADGSLRETTKISNLAGDLNTSLALRGEFGTSLAAMGDRDRDGRRELAVGAGRRDGGDLTHGAVFLLELDPDGTVAEGMASEFQTPFLSGELAANDRFGRSVLLVDDLNGDGQRDLLAGASGDDTVGPDRGGLWLLTLSDVVPPILLETYCSGSDAVELPLRRAALAGVRQRSRQLSPGATRSAGQPGRAALGHLASGRTDGLAGRTVAVPRGRHLPGHRDRCGRRPRQCRGRAAGLRGPVHGIAAGEHRGPRPADDLVPGVARSRGTRGRCSRSSAFPATLPGGLAPGPPSTRSTSRSRAAGPRSRTSRSGAPTGSSPGRPRPWTSPGGAAETSPITIPLPGPGEAGGELAGWVQIANPFADAVPLSALQVSNGGAPEPFLAQVGLNLTEPALHVFDGNGYQRLESGTDTLVPGQGAWVRKRTGGPADLIVPPTFTKGGTDPDAADPRFDWELRLELRDGTRAIQRLDLATTRDPGLAERLALGAPPQAPGAPAPRMRIVTEDGARVRSRVVSDAADPRWELEIADASGLVLVAHLLGHPDREVTISLADGVRIGAVQRLGSITLPLSVGQHRLVVETPKADPDPTLVASTGVAPYPNPFRSETVMRFRTARSGPVELEVYDLAGRRVRQLRRGRLEAGEHVLGWDGNDQSGQPVAAGVYMLRVLRPGETPITERVVRLR